VEQFGTTGHPINAPQQPVRVCICPVWLDRVSKRPSVKADLLIYHILQIVRGGKVSRLQNSTVICWKTFAVGPSLPFFFYNLLSEGNYFTGKVSRLPVDPQKLRNFSTSKDLQYTVYQL